MFNGRASGHPAVRRTFEDENVKLIRGEPVPSQLTRIQIGVTARVFRPLPTDGGKVIARLAVYLSCDLGICQNG